MVVLCELALTLMILLFFSHLFQLAALESGINPQKQSASSNGTFLAKQTPQQTALPRPFVRILSTNIIVLTTPTLALCARVDQLSFITAIAALETGNFQPIRRTSRFWSMRTPQTLPTLDSDV
ncbi:hypothetical protein C8R43DRAFT_1103279 [Mycena crocata]|nr:hypothetical protein C8R43DRAFT_1103279 [Mycena crocata]